MLDVLISATRCVFGGGKFDSDFRYIRATTDGARTSIVQGPSVAIARNATTASIAWRFQVGSYVMTGPGRQIAAPTSVSNVATRVAL